MHAKNALYACTEMHVGLGNLIIWILLTNIGVDSGRDISTGDLRFFQECSNYSRSFTSSRSSPLSPGRMSDFLQPHNKCLLSSICL